MVSIQFDFDIDGALQEDPYLDRFELHYMFQQTQEKMGEALQRKLGQMTCDEHQQHPTITITGRYNTETERFDIDYHLDTCCKLFMAKVISALNNIN